MKWEHIEIKLSDGITHYIDDYYDFKCSVDIEGWEKHDTDEEDDLIELAVATAYVKNGEKPRIEVMLKEEYRKVLEFNFIFQKAKREALVILEEEINDFIDEYCL